MAKDNKKAPEVSTKPAEPNANVKAPEATVDPNANVKAPDVKVEAEKIKVHAPYVVAPGCSLTTKSRGVKGPGEGIINEDFSGDEKQRGKAIETLLAKKKLVKN